MGVVSDVGLRVGVENLDRHAAGQARKEAGRTGRCDVGDVLAGRRLDRDTKELRVDPEGRAAVIARENAREAGPVAQGIDRRVAADERLGVLIQQRDTDSAANAGSRGSDGEAARDQVGDGIVGGVDQDAAARRLARAPNASLVASSPIFAQVVSFTLTYETEPPTAAVPATAPAAAIDKTSPLECAWTSILPRAVTIAPSSIAAVVVLLITTTTTPGVMLAVARDRECGGNPQERGIVAGRDQD